jgi:integrase
MAKAFQEGAGWAFRLRVRGQDIYRSGFRTAAAAKDAMVGIKHEYTGASQAAGIGPFRTPLAVAFSDYAVQRLPFLKGARQDKDRINRYLRTLGLPVIHLEKDESSTADSQRYWNVMLVREDGRLIIKSLQAHRVAQSRQTLRADEVRARLAATPMADVTTYQVQELINAMMSDGAGAATIDHERAELRRLFSHARRVWHWKNPQLNPASDVTAPPVDNARDRVLTNDEWKLVAKELAKYGNVYVLPLVCLMLETAMRSCEPLSYATWGDVNWSRRVLCLRDSKTGKREVSLGPGAIALLEELKRKAGAVADESGIFPTTYEAIKKAWSVACKQSGVTDVGLHDLRHTAATRYSRQFKGNLPVIMHITGHKTVGMAMRYINIKADDVVQMMHGEELDVGRSPAGYGATLLEGISRATEEKSPPSEPAAAGITAS